MPLPFNKYKIWLVVSVLGTDSDTNDSPVLQTLLPSCIQLFMGLKTKDKIKNNYQSELVIESIEFCSNVFRCVVGERYDKPFDAEIIMNAWNPD